MRARSPRREAGGGSEEEEALGLLDNLDLDLGRDTVDDLDLNLLDLFDGDFHGGVGVDIVIGPRSSLKDGPLAREWILAAIASEGKGAACAPSRAGRGRAAPAAGERGTGAAMGLELDVADEELALGTLGEESAFAGGRGGDGGSGRWAVEGHAGL